MGKLKSVTGQGKAGDPSEDTAPTGPKRAWGLLQQLGRVAWNVIKLVGRVGAAALRRLPIAALSFARALGSDHYAEELRSLHANFATSPAVRKGTLTPPAAELEKAPPDSALLLLNLLQKEGRFVDFVQEDVTNYSDAEIGAAARVVHQGCGRVLRDHIEIAPVRAESEGSRVTLQRGFDPAEVKPTGQVLGEPPFTGSLVHRGWRAMEIHLPQVASSRDLRILAAAEVEL